MDYVEVSAKLNYDIEVPFETLTAKIMREEMLIDG